MNSRLKGGKLRISGVMILCVQQHQNQIISLINKGILYNWTNFQLTIVLFINISIAQERHCIKVRIISSYLISYIIYIVKLHCTFKFISNYVFSISHLIRINGYIYCAFSISLVVLLHGRGQFVKDTVSSARQKNTTFECRRLLII